ncbi:MAG TPA: tRNA (cytidine(34)-2'-O)-methyltransferase [Chthoniobacteraceae bacterium]|nr:tRNA (cytidine(34)-2'-O)-methyltransferase [Chthoniobacteraceae bacterium]
MKSPALNVVLHQPEIPANTGNIARTCLATGSTLHLIKPLGFSIDDKQLKRAGLDYWHEVDVRLWESIEELFAATAEARARRFLFTTKCERPYSAAQYRAGDWLFFGRETKGLPESLLAEYAAQCVTIPMCNAARSLNLSVSVGVGVFEACRQISEQAF